MLLSNLLNDRNLDKYKQVTIFTIDTTGLDRTKLKVDNHFKSIVPGIQSYIYEDAIPAEYIVNSEDIITSEKDLYRETNIDTSSLFSSDKW